jgi:hypothetical protein
MEEDDGDDDDDDDEIHFDRRNETLTLKTDS